VELEGLMVNFFLLVLGEREIFFLFSLNKESIFFLLVLIRRILFFFFWFNKEEYLFLQF